MPTINFKVQNPHVSPNAIRATVKGVETTATIDMFEVDLVAKDDREHGSLKLRFFQDMDAMKAAFPVDKMVPVTIGEPFDDPNPPAA